MSYLGSIGNNLAMLGPEGQQGLMTLLAGHAEQYAARKKAMDERLGFINQALEAHSAGQKAREGGDIAAHEAIFGAGPDSALTAFANTHAAQAPVLDERGATMQRLGDAAMEAWQQERSARGRGNAGGPGAFERAMANADAEVGARNRRLDVEAQAREAPSEALRQFGNIARDGNWGANLAQLTAGKERDLAGIDARGHDTVRGLRDWQASQVRTQYNPMGTLARAFGPRMMRRGAAGERQRRASLFGGGGL